MAIILKIEATSTSLSVISIVKFSGKNLISDSRFINPLSLLKKERFALLGVRSFLARPCIVVSVMSLIDLILGNCFSTEKAGVFIKNKANNAVVRQRN